MNKSIAISILFLAISLPAKANQYLAHCYPMPHPSLIRSLMMRGVDAQPILSYTVVPSFEAEHGFVVYEKGGAFVLRSIRFRSSVWSDPGWSKPRPEGAGWIERHIDANERIVSGAFVSTLSNLLDREISLVQSRSADEFVLDGVSYQVKLGESCAEAMSPIPPSRMAELIGILERVGTIAGAWTESGGKRREQKAMKLIDEFQAPSPSS